MLQEVARQEWRARGARPEEEEVGAEPIVVRAYGSASFLDEAPRLIDLIPVRWMTLLAAVAVAGATVAGLLAAYPLLGVVGGAWFPRGLGTFDLDSPANLAGCYSSLVLALAALYAFLVFSIRRHRVDDYAGTYRIWGWTAAVWLFMCLDEPAGLHLAFRDVMIAWTNSYVIGDGSLWWITPYFLVLTGVGVRILIDMRRDVLASGLLLLVGAAYAAAVALQWPGVELVEGARLVMWEEGLEMTGHTLAALAMAVHARFVLLQAEGYYPAPAVLRRTAAGLVAEPRRSWWGRLWRGEPNASAPPATKPRTLRRQDDTRLVIHPPHGRGRPRVLRRQVRSEAKAPLEEGGDVQREEQINAFLAGMAANESTANSAPRTDRQRKQRRSSAGGKSSGSSGGSTASSDSSSSLPRRKLTKEEKKRLKKYYAQRQAQQRSA